MSLPITVQNLKPPDAIGVEKNPFHFEKLTLKNPKKRGFFGVFASDALLRQKVKNLEWPKVASCPCGHFKLKIDAFEALLCLTRSDED